MTKETVEQEIKTYVMNNYAAKLGSSTQCRIYKNQIFIYIDSDIYHQLHSVNINLESSANYISASYYAEPEVYKMIDDLATKWNIRTASQVVADEISPAFAKLIKQHNYNVYIHSGDSSQNEFTFELLSARAPYINLKITPRFREIGLRDERDLNEWIKSNPEAVKEMFRELDILDYELKSDYYSSSEDISLWLDL